MKIETILTPAELPALAQRDLRATACVVFDVLRATSTFVTALHHGAKAIIPVSEIAEALAKCGKKPEPRNILLGGERNGVKIRTVQKWDRHLACQEQAGSCPTTKLISTLAIHRANTRRKKCAAKPLSPRPQTGRAPCAPA